MIEFFSGKGGITVGASPDPHRLAAPAQDVFAPVLQSPEMPRRIASGPGSDRANQWIADHKRAR
jgi:hypothetical protein